MRSPCCLSVFLSVYPLLIFLVFYAVRVVQKENRRLGFVRTSCYEHVEISSLFQ
jgi:hypothetical protein